MRPENFWKRLPLNEYFRKIVLKIALWGMIEEGKKKSDEIEAGSSILRLSVSVDFEFRIYFYPFSYLPSELIIFPLRKIGWTGFDNNRTMSYSQAAS
jgi:hypothetical protein